MTTLETLQKRHEKARNDLKQIYAEKCNRGELVKTVAKVAALLEVSPQTIYNYASGKAKDGFLTEAIIETFKNIDVG